MIPAPSLPGRGSSLCLAALHALPPTCPFTRNAPSDLSPGNKGRQLSPARRQLGHCFPSARLLWKLHPVPDLAYHYVPTQASLPSCPPISPAACWTPPSLRCLKPNLPKTDLDIFHLQISFSSNFPTQKGTCPLRSHPSQKPSVICSKQSLFSVPPTKCQKSFHSLPSVPKAPAWSRAFRVALQACCSRL